MTRRAALAAGGWSCLPGCSSFPGSSSSSIDFACGAGVRGGEGRVVGGSIGSAGS